MRQVGSARVRVGVPAVLLAWAVFAGVLLLVPNRSGASSVAGSTGLFLAAVVFTVVAWQRAAWHHAAEAGRWPGRGWRLLAAGGAAFAAGQCAWAYQQVRGWPVPFPSWAEALFLLEFPLIAAGVLCLADQSMRAVSRVRIIVDGLLLVTALLILFWDVALRPAYLEQAGAGRVALLVGLAFPLAHVVVLSLIGAVAVHSSARSRDFAFLAAGLLTSALAYAVFGWLAARQSYFTGHLVDSLWVLSFGLMCLAAWSPQSVAVRAQGGTALHEEAGAQEVAARRLGWGVRAGAAPAVVPVLLAAGAVALLAVQLLWWGDLDLAHTGLGVCLGIMLLGRQWLSLREHALLSRSLEQRVAERTAELTARTADLAARSKELTASRQRYQSVLDSVHEVIFQADLHGAITFVSRAWQELTGAPVDQALGRPLAALVDPKDASAVNEAVGRALMSSTPVQVQLRLLHRDEAPCWAEVGVQVLNDEHGAPVGLAGTLRDISDRHRAEEALRHSERRWRLLLESTSEGIFGLDLDGRCTFVNTAAAAMVGLDPVELVGRNVHELVHHSHADGSPYPLSECPVLPAVRAGRGCHLSEELLHRADGSSFLAEVNARPVYGDGQVEAAVKTVVDITSRHAAQQEVRHRALHDPLTDLPNRALLSDRLEQAIAGTSRSGEPTALMVLDLDGFKDVNDRFGHQAGDELLREIATRLSASGLLRASDTVARLGGDEFALVLPGLRDTTDAAAVARKVLDTIGEPILTGTGTLQVGCSLGIAIAPDDARDAFTLLQRADVAMYLAKSGGGGIARYHAEHDRARLHRLELADDLRAAVDAAQLYLNYQPVIDLRTGDVDHVEALCRWQHPRRGNVSAQTFIDIAEQAGLIGDLTRHVLVLAHQQSQAWRSAGLHVPIAVNISATTLHDAELLQAAYDWHHSDPPAGPLEIEVTESAVMTHPALAIEQLQRLTNLGVRVSIDDFGTGYSSLAHLRDMPVHAVKIDRSFLVGTHQDPSVEHPAERSVEHGGQHPGDRRRQRDHALVESIIQLGHTLDLTVIAEGVENAQTAQRLRELGCDEAQGFHFGRPQLAQQLTAALRPLRAEPTPPA
ncbi:PAS domain S-box-containing protein/diguanylate cyclase (GGDEF)-like protein [Kineococcus xinjiangensis]|uniref:PAS domain S-box-containing protein/diguanylate cyclase (GGDEF)-like protein n=1 Tax=Kineococcus xinjiangensis TaxID=512762 RepID=A0A2S6IUC1_9ACTN|nr:bifunctional diguanylate cyclase/phosphodiesterase [Kineococcus xinjiangensis]PPK97861.1 PAS domain S-box-containing protein/diguanylate cyclase (GGDEF)-like protein [Kineococcus xinjiangensis]